MKESSYILSVILIIGLAFVSFSCADEGSTTNKKNSQKAALEKPIQDIEEIGDISGPITITGTFPSARAMEGKTVMLYETEGKDRFTLDSAIISDGKYRFDLADAEIGMYRIGNMPVEKFQGDIILNPNEKEIHIDHSKFNFIEGMTFSNSPENTAWQNFLAQEKAYNADLKTVRKSDASRAVKLERILARNRQFDTQQEKMALALPQTFFAKIARRYQSPRLDDRNHFWDDIDFKDESLIHSEMLNTRLNTYIQTYAKLDHTDKDPTLGYYNTVDRIANIVKERGSSKMLEFMLYMISERFYRSGNEDVSLYVIDNYFYGDACGDAEISELFKMKAAGIRNLQVGNKPPDFVLPDPNGKEIRMSDIVKENEYTLILFWASFCEHCKEEIPQMLKFYPSYSKAGFEVLGVSVDASQKAWVKGIKDQSIPWPNVSDLTHWGGPVLKDYRVTKTPVMFLLDKNGILVQRPESVQELKTFLKKEMG